MDEFDKEAHAQEVTSHVEETETFNLGREILEWVNVIVIALVITLIVKVFIFDIVRVDGSSMYPTLINNDRLVVTKLGYKPSAGDIIILDSAYKKRQEYIASLERTTGKEMTFLQKVKFKFTKPDYLKEIYYVKRIIALPGQTIDLTDDGEVTVDGKVLDEPYYKGTTKPIDARVQFPIKVAEGNVFVMGDNRNASKDSRSSELGQVPFDAIMGKAQLRIWPLNKLGMIEHYKHE